MRFTDHDAAAAKIKELSDGRQFEGIYFTLNSFPSDLVFEKASSAVANDQVTGRDWLFLDFDVARPPHPVEWTIDKADPDELKAEKKAKIANWKWVHGNATAEELQASKTAC
jgi:hypothetical protein